MKTIVTAAILFGLVTPAFAEHVGFWDVVSGKRVSTHTSQEECQVKLLDAKPIADREGTEATEQVFVLEDGTYSAFTVMKNGRGDVLKEITFIVYDNCDIQLQTNKDT